MRILMTLYVSTALDGKFRKSNSSNTEFLLILGKESLDFRKVKKHFPLKF